MGRSLGEEIGYPHQYSWASLVAQLLKNPPEMQETWVRSLGWEYPLGKGKATHSIIFWPGEFHRLNSPWGHKELDTTERLSHTNILGKAKKNSSHTDLKLKSEKRMLAGKQEIRW